MLELPKSESCGVESVEAPPNIEGAVVVGADVVELPNKPAGFEAPPKNEVVEED